MLIRYGKKETKTIAITPYDYYLIYEKMIKENTMVNLMKTTLFHFMFAHGLRTDSLNAIQIKDIVWKPLTVPIHSQYYQDSSYIIRFNLGIWISKDKARNNQYYQFVRGNLYYPDCSNVLLILYLYFIRNAFIQNNLNEIIWNGYLRMKEEKLNEWLFIKGIDDFYSNKTIAYLIQKYEKKADISLKYSPRSFRTGIVNRWLINTMLENNQFHNYQDERELLTFMGWKSHDSLYYYKRQFLYQYLPNKHSHENEPPLNHHQESITILPNEFEELKEQMKQDGYNTHVFF